MEITSLRNSIEAAQAASLLDLATLCAIPSVSAKCQGQLECAKQTAELLRIHGIDADLMETAGGPPVVFGSLHSTISDAPTVLFYNHYDVQPAEPMELWDSNPFDLTIREGKAYARGAADDKGHITSRLLALKALRELQGGELNFHVRFLIEGEEEIGSPHLGAFIEKHAELLAADACIWEEGGVDETGKPVLYCGMRGIAYFELHSHTISYDAHSGVGGSLLPNAAWRLVWALSTLKNCHEQILIPNHYDDAKPPTLRDMQLLDLLPGNERYMRSEFGLDAGGALGGKRTTGLEFKRRGAFEPTLTLCGIESGWHGEGAKTVLPSSAMAKIDFRLIPDQDPGKIDAALRAHLQTQGFNDIEVRYMCGQRPARVDPDHPLVQLAVLTAADVYGQPADVVPMVGGSGPMWWFTGRLGLPVTSPGVEYPGCRVHAPNEHIRLADYTNGTLHLAYLLSRIGEAVGAPPPLPGPKGR